jgi:DNA-binding GntR family transcriptional regulator
MPSSGSGASRSARLSAVPTSAVRVAPYEMIKKAILAGDLKPGQPLVEAALAAWCEVSRTPIREALRRLEQDGLINRSDRGLVVCKRSPEEILDIYETRVVLEATAGRVAAERRTEHDIRLLRRILERGAAASQNDVDEMVDANQQLHRAVWRATHNESLIDLLERLNLHLARYPGTTLSAPGRWQVALREHELLVDAIEGRDGDTAHEAAMNHFTEARNIRLQLFVDGESSS